MRTQRAGIKHWVARTIIIFSAAILLGVSGGEINASQKPNRTAPASRRSRIPKLGNVDQFKEGFQHDAGKVRLVALISPT
jgi:hypothetical protein